MNLLKVQDKLKGREYRTIEEVLDHIQLVWDNCKAYNPEGAFYVLADKMERAFKKMIRNYLPNIQVVVPSNFQLIKNPLCPTQIIANPTLNTRFPRIITRNLSQSSLSVLLRHPSTIIRSIIVAHMMNLPQLMSQGRTFRRCSRSHSPKKTDSTKD